MRKITNPSMTQKTLPQKPDPREDRVAEALRENLRRRKAQQQARQTTGD